MPEEFADSKEARGIKLFFYLKSGNSLLNEGKNLITFIFAGYFALKLSNPIWLIAMFGISLPILAVVGWFCVHKWNKILEWLSVKYGTHYAIKQYTLVERQTELLEEINKKIKG